MKKGVTSYICYLLFLAAYLVYGIAAFWGNGLILSTTVAFVTISATLAGLTASRGTKKEGARGKQLRELINGRRTIPITSVASQTGSSVHDAARIVKRSGFLALSSDGATVVNMEMLQDDLRSHVNSLGEIDVPAISAAWSLDLEYAKVLVRSMEKNVVVNSAGQFYFIPAVAKILESALETTGRVSGNEEAMKRKLSLWQLNGILLHLRTKSGVSVTLGGTYLRMGTVIHELQALLEKRGVIDIALESKKLGITDGSLMNQFVASLDISYVRITGTSIIARSSWIDELRKRIIEAGVVDVHELGSSLGLSSSQLGIVLSQHVDGFLDDLTHTFYARGTAALTRAAVRPRQVYAPQESQPDVQVLRGGEFVGNRLRYKVKVLNNTKFVITDITVSLVTYPRDALTLEGPIVKAIAKIDPGGFNSPLFEFLPSRDCVKGEVIASVYYVDHEGKPHMAMTDPFTVRAVCDLLIPETITPQQFEIKLADFSHGEMTFKVEDWTPEEMHSKALQVLEKSNFSEVTTDQGMIGEHIQSRITGWARGKYTKKNLGVELTITGRPGKRGATCSVRMSGEDEAMIMPAIDEMSQNLTAWLCPMCGGDMPEQAVVQIRDGKQSKCPFCGVTVGR